MRYHTKEYYTLMMAQGAADLYEPIIDKEYTDEDIEDLYQQAMDRYIEEEREDYDAPPVLILDDGDPDSGLLDEILLQRRLELAFEGHRYFDRKRLGLDILRPEGLPTVPYSDYRLVAAIGTTELDVNKLLVQNPGY